MTDAKPPVQFFDWATELSDAQGHVTLSEQEAHEIGARLRRLHSENETLQAGYAAARLEIESLQARIKVLAEEHADELTVAHLDGRMRVAQPAGAQQPDTAYAELPSYEHQRAIMEAERNASLDEYSRIVPLTSTESMIYERAFTNGWNRRASHEQAPAQAADSLLEDAGGANWQDISTAPKDGTRFVAVGQNYGLDSETQHTCIAQRLAGCWIEVSDWNGASKLKYLTHWMPLPPLPGSAARKEGGA